MTRDVNMTQTDAAKLNVHAPGAIAILGAGAIGQLIHHQLTASGCLPYFIVRAESNAKWHQDYQQQLSFTDLEGKVVQSCATLITTADNTDKAQFLNHTKLIIVCVKSYQVYGALAPQIKHLDKHCHILLLHNGMGPHLQVQGILNGQGLSLGTTSQGALSLSRWHIKQTGTGLTQLGHFEGAPMADELTRLLLNAIPGSQWCQPILPYLWQKLAVNATINPLTAIHDCPNGKLIEAQFSPQIKAVISELIKVAKADGIELDKLALTERVYQAINLTANNYSSMHQDVAKYRKTEIEAINGYVVQRARQHLLSIPSNLMLLNSIQQLEANYLT